MKNQPMHSTNRLFAVACMGILLFGIGVTTLGSMLPELVDRFQVSDLAAGGLASMLPLGILFGSLFFGPLADQYGYKLLLIFCISLLMLGMEGMAFAQSWLWVQAAVFLIGVGGGAVNGATSALVVDISEGKRGARLSLLGVFFGIGALGMPGLLGFLTQWYTSSQILAAIGGIMLVVILFIATTNFPLAKQQQGLPKDQTLRLLKDPILLLFSTLLFFQSGIEALAMNWSTSYLQGNQGFSMTSSLYILSIHLGALTAMRFLLGVLLRYISPFQALSIGVVLTLLGILLLWQSTSYSMTIIAYIILGMGYSGTFPILMGRIGDFWPALSGTAFSITLVISLFGNILVNNLMGWLSFQYGIHFYPYLFLACAGSVVLFLLISRRHLGHHVTAIIT